MEDFPSRPNYKTLQILGQGSFGSAYKVLNEENNDIYVVKKILLKGAKKEEINEIKNEAKILSSIKSENIVKYIDSFEDKESFNIVMEYCDGLDLRKYIEDHKKSNDYIEKDIILHFISEMCNAIEEIHKNKLIHRDLKPDNIFLTGDLKVKIGDFGIAKQLNNVNAYAKTQAGTILYMAPEIINGQKYNNKVDIWSLGCIIHELCTLNFCFNNNSINGLISQITQSKHQKIDQKLYGADFQNLIDSMLNTDYKKRPRIEDIKKQINSKMGELMIEKIVGLFEKDESYQNYLIEKNIQNSIDQVNFTVLSRELKFGKIKYFVGLAILSISTAIVSGGLSLIGSLALGAGVGGFGGFLLNKILGVDKKANFINNNSIIIDSIQNKLITKIKEQLDENILKQNIIIYNKENFELKIEKIKNKLLEKNYIKRLQKMITKNFNILLVGCTNAGKSTLINEFLKLTDKEKARESEGGPTDTVDFTPYKGKNKTKNYTLYDTNGITNKGVDSIELKRENTIKEIERRLKSHDPNELIHCIWYCFQGSNVQPSDKDFIESLLKIYTTYTIPIIFIHTQTYSKKQSNTCKLGIEKYLNEIYNNDKKEVESQLNNYISILARGDEEEEKEAFGLDELERLSQKEIEAKGIKSSYFEYIKQDIMPILINGVFNLIFTEYNIKELTDKSKESLEIYLKSILKIVNNDKLGLSEDIKSKNKDSLIKLCDCFKNIREKCREELLDLLRMEQLKKDNEELVKRLYERKSEEYKKDMSYKKFCKNVENLIYDNIANNKKEIINNVLIHGFNFFIIQIIKIGISEQFKNKEEAILNEIYTEIFKELNKNDN